jgi:hypothetical protein
MAEIYFDVDTALSEVPVNIFPLTDDTDFKTRETSITYNQAGMDLVWNFVTTAGAFTQTAVTPTTGGNYDWANQGDGMYSIEIPASGGASINNDTEGHGWFTGICTGVLPWRSPIFGFRSAALNNALIDGGDLLDVNVTHIADTAQTGRDIGTSVLLSSGTGTGQISLSSGAVTVGTNNDKTGYTISGTKQTLDALNDFNHSSDTVARVTLVDTCTTNTDMRGTNGAYTGTPPTVVQIRTEIDTTSTQLASIKAKTDNLPSGIKKGVALNNFVILMKDSTDHSSGKTGLTVTGTIRKDAGSFTSLSGTITEINYGLYSIDTISSDEMNADILTLRFTATGADDTFIEIKTV